MGIIFLANYLLFSFFFTAIFQQELTFDYVLKSPYHGFFKICFTVHMVWNSSKGMKTFCKDL